MGVPGVLEPPCLDQKLIVSVQLVFASQKRLFRSRRLCYEERVASSSSEDRLLWTGCGRLPAAIDKVVAKKLLVFAAIRKAEREVLGLLQG